MRKAILALSVVAIIAIVFLVRRSNESTSVPSGASSTDPQASAAANTPKPPTPGEVASDVTACVFSPTPGKKLCLGAPQGLKFSNPADGPALAKWIDKLDLRWRREWKDVERDPKGATTRPKLNVAVLDDAETVALAGLGNSEIIVARIKAVKPKDPEDKRYGIYDPNSEYEKYYYVVMDGWKPTGDETSVDVVIGDWKLYGIKKATGGNAASVVQRGNTGKFRFCKNEHPQYRKVWGSRFMTCEVARLLHDAEQGLLASGVLGRDESLLGVVDTLSSGKTDTASLKKAIDQLLARRGAVQMTPPEKSATESKLLALLQRLDVDDPFAPAWVICGGGCCTADE